MIFSIDYSSLFVGKILCFAGMFVKVIIDGLSKYNRKLEQLARCNISFVQDAILRNAGILNASIWQS
jgi:hypothetical protein